MADSVTLPAKTVLAVFFDTTTTDRRRWLLRARSGMIEENGHPRVGEFS